MSKLQKLQQDSPVAFGPLFNFMRNWSGEFKPHAELLDKESLVQKNGDAKTDGPIRFVATLSFSRCFPLDPHPDFCWVAAG